MEISQKLEKNYDHVLIGYNLTSLSFAFELAKRGEKFCLLDSKHFGSSPFKFIPTLEQDIYARVPFNSYSEELLKQNPDLKLIEGTPLTFDKGNFRSFLGFGEKKIEAIDAVERYCETRGLQSEAAPERFWHEMEPILSQNIFLDQIITEILHEENDITEVTLNGKTQLRGKHFYFFDQFPFLFDQVGKKVKKLASQFAKAKWFSSVNLIVHHQEKPEVFELEQLYMLMGSKEQPCLGQFSLIGEQLISRWESFFPSELTPDNETTGASLKEIKKQVKRAFSPNGTTENPENILIQNQVFADMSKTELKNGKLGNFNNLYIASPLFGHATGWIHEMATGASALSFTLEASEKNADDPAIEVAAPGTPC